MLQDSSYLRVDQLQAGHRVHGGATVTCVLVTMVEDAVVVRLGADNGCALTSYHPVCVDGQWAFPKDLAAPEIISACTLYNFVLDRQHTLVVNGVTACTLAHDMRGAVIGHPYFGAREASQRNILDDLSLSPGYAAGRVVWEGVTVRRDPATDFIVKLAPKRDVSVHKHESAVAMHAEPASAAAV